MSNDLRKLPIDLNMSKDSIVKLHNEVMLSVKTTMDKVMQIGNLLLDIKEEIPYGEFCSYVDKNLPFSMRTAQNYMRVYLNKDKIKEIKDVSSAYAMIENKSLKKEKAEKPEAEIETAEDEINIDVDDTECVIPETERNSNNFLYWRDVEIAVKALERAYEKLSSVRDHTTPIALAHFIGNLKDMSNRINTWNPQRLMTCPVCGGTGLDPTTDQPCRICIGGLLGIYKESNN